MADNRDNSHPTKTWPASEIAIKSVGSLTPYARNARTHSDDQIAQIAASMKEWGWTNPVLIDEGGGIIAGHGRILAARKLGISEVPCIVAEGWTEVQKRAYVIADNKLALNADWGTELLRLEIQALDEADFKLANLGFSGSEFDLLMFDGDFEPGTENDQGRLDELAPKIVTCPHCGEQFDSRADE